MAAVILRHQWSNTLVKHCLLCGKRAWTTKDYFEGVCPVKYAVSPDDQRRLENNFVYHPPKEDQVERYDLVRTKARSFAEVVLGCCPQSRERSLALTAIEDAMMQANAAIARNE